MDDSVGRAIEQQLRAGKSAESIALEVINAFAIHNIELHRVIEANKTSLKPDSKPVVARSHYNSKEVQERLGISQRTLYGLSVNKAVITSRHDPVGSRETLYDRSEIDNLFYAKACEPLPADLSVILIKVNPGTYPANGSAKSKQDALARALVNHPSLQTGDHVAVATSKWIMEIWRVSSIETLDVLPIVNLQPASKSVADRYVLRRYPGSGRGTKKMWLNKRLDG